MSVRCHPAIIPDTHKPNLACFSAFDAFYRYGIVTIPPVTAKNAELHGRCRRSDSPKGPLFRAFFKNGEM
jgi:hypothetical protein